MSSTHCPDCGCVLSAGGKPRSVDQHRRYFGLIKAVFHHWPENHAHQFSSTEELRSFLQMKAGHREIGAQIPLIGINRERAMLLAEAAIRAAGSYAVPVLHGDTLVVFKPKSISFGKLSHSAFCALNNAVDDVIRAETGMDPDQLLKEHGRAA